MGLSALFLPAGSDGLPLGVEGHGTLTVEVGVTPHGGFVASEGEHGEWHWDGKVDADLASLNFILILTGGVAVLGEN